MFRNTRFHNYRLNRPSQSPLGFLADPKFQPWIVASKFLGSLLLAYCVTFLPEHAGLKDSGRVAFFILLFSVGLWVTEAMPAFAVGLLVIGLEIVTLGRPGGVMDAGPDDWQRYVTTWGSPLIWLFLGGFVMAAAAEKTGLTIWVSTQVLSRIGERPWWLLAGVMGITFTFSMFISNTAATAMMVAVVLPIVNSLAGGDPLRRALLLGIAMAANIGGMGTLIGSPPNAIAAGALQNVARVSFASWMLAAIPPAICLILVAWGYLLFRYPAWVERVDFNRLSRVSEEDTNPNGNNLHRWIVIAIFCTTVLLWMSQSLHGIPATVISFLPICLLTATGILTSRDIRSIRWDVLLLIAGGLSLGLAVTESGLASWLTDKLPLGKLGMMALALAFAYFTVAISNVMSNTVAANILVPIAVVAAAGHEPQVVVPLALAASSSMCLPISTPPNAIVYGTEELSSRELIESGLIVGCLSPIISVLWCSLVFAN